jgi:phosphoribosyl 1,2-cyclic phosphodiesterase
MKVTVWGTRGSQAAPGPDTVRYGGNTSCVEVETVADARVVLDAGTGLRRVGLALEPEVRRVDILLTHLHMDHIQGLGFFTPLFRRGFEVHIWGPGSATDNLRRRLTRYMSPPLFPVRLPELPCQLQLHDLNEEPIDVPGLTIRTALVCHPGPTVGFRLEGDGGSLAFLPDHEPALASRRFAEAPEWCSGLELAAGVDVLLHDAQYTEAEYAERVGWGHSTLQHALAFARLARVKQFMPFHFDPAHDDDTLDAHFASAIAGNTERFTIVPAREDATFDVISAGRTPQG